MDFADHGAAASLMRYRSAPGMFLAGHLAHEPDEDDAAATENAFARFLSGDSSCHTSESRDFRAGDTGDKEELTQHPQSGHFAATSSPMMYQTVTTADGRGPALGGVGVGSLGVDAGAVRTNGGGGLVRHSSSPAGLFSHLAVDNGFSLMRNMGSFRNGSGSNGEMTPASQLKPQLSFPSPASSARLMSQIPEMGCDGMAASSSEEGGLTNGSRGRRSHIPGFPVGSWEDSHVVSENFSVLQSRDTMARKRARDLDTKLMSAGFNISHPQNGDSLTHGPVLSHQFSLPKTSSEMAAVEKFLQMHDSVPCKVRAKRGCATHPRSIAERVRRTRISERMRKLQELVPNMDKQTNTADMLELAVEYIKDLQKKVQALSESRSSCTCGSKQKSYPSSVM